MRVRDTGCIRLARGGIASFNIVIVVLLSKFFITIATAAAATAASAPARLTVGIQSVLAFAIECLAVLLRARRAVLRQLFTTVFGRHADSSGSIFES
jgi:uncharacterized protein with von Willebrand factor type A (vWA) domain